MNTLHLLNKSPFSTHSFETALMFLDEHDGILLTGDAVYALLTNTILPTKIEPLSAHVYALEEDVATRAISPIADNVKIIDYPSFVKLCTEYKKVVTWS